MAATPTCAHCGEPSDISMLCRTCTKKVTVAERAAQGLPPTVEDPVALHTLTVLATARPAMPARKAS